MNYTPTDNPNFVRERSSGALINNNTGELNMLRAQRDRVFNDRKEMQDLKRQIEELKRLILER